MKSVGGNNKDTEPPFHAKGSAGQSFIIGLAHLMAIAVRARPRLKAQAARLGRLLGLTVLAFQDTFPPPRSGSIQVPGRKTRDHRGKGGPKLRVIGFKRVMLLLVLPTLPGCAGVPPLPEPAALDRSNDSPENLGYSGGRGRASFPVPPSQAAAAVAEALGDLGIELRQQSRDGAVVRIEGTTHDQRPVNVMIRSSREQSFLAVRIGWFGDEPLTRAILERVGVRLGRLPPQPIPPCAPSEPAANPYFSRNAIPDSVMLRDLAESPYRDRVIP